MTDSAIPPAIDFSSFDPDTRVQDDLFRHVNGHWLEVTEIPADKPVTGAFIAYGFEVTPDGRKLIIVQSNTGKLFTVDRRTGRTRTIDLDGATVPNGDGLLLKGRTLFVVQNQLNLVAVVKLSRSGRAGEV